MQTMGWLSLILLAVGSVLVLVSVAFRKREGLIATTGLVCLVAGILLLIFGHDLLHS
jgi:membrane-bound ClpP family serine protease